MSQQTLSLNSELYYSIESINIMCFFTMLLVFLEKYTYIIIMNVRNKIKVYRDVKLAIPEKMLVECHVTYVFILLLSVFQGDEHNE